MTGISIEVTSDRNENTKIFGTVESAIEYCRARLNENFTVTLRSGGYNSIVEKTKAQLYANLSNIRVR